MSIRDALSRAQINKPVADPLMGEEDDDFFDGEDEGFAVQSFEVSGAGGASGGLNHTGSGVGAGVPGSVVSGASGAVLGANGEDSKGSGAGGGVGSGAGTEDSVGSEDGAGTTAGQGTAMEDEVSSIEPSSGTADLISTEYTISIPSDLASITTEAEGTAEDDEYTFDDSTISEIYGDTTNGLDPDIRAKEASDRLMTVLLHEGDEFKTARKHLYNSLSPSVFTDENYMLYRLFYNFRDRNFALTEEFIESYYSYHLGDIDNSSKKIDIQAYGKIEDSYAKGYLSGILKQYRKLTELEPATDESFYRSIEEYRTYRKHSLAVDAIANAYEILEEGLKSKGTAKTLTGFTDAQSYLKREMSSIEAMFDDDNGVGYVSLRDAVLAPPEETKITRIGDFGLVEELNEALGGIYSGQLIVVAGPSKAGKTKFCTRLVYDMLMQGQNVTVMPVEGGIQMFQAQIRAIHFHEYYKRATGENGNAKFPISQQVIYQNDFSSIELESNLDLRSMEMMSARDLVENPAYGQLDLIDMNLHLDSFIDTVDGSVSSNHSSVVFIDYMQLINYPNNMTRQQALSKAFPALLRYCKQKNVAVITPAQYTQSAVNDMGKGEVGDTRTMIGDSYEIYKSADLVIAMAGTVEDLKNGIVTFESIPARLAKPFDPFKVFADLGSCEFVSINQEVG